MEQQEIFGRFVLVKRLSEPDVERGSVETFRAVDPERALKPLVVVDRAPIIERETIAAAAAAHEVVSSTYMAEPVGSGVIGPYVWRARAWLPGITVERLLARELPLPVALTVSYLIAFAAADAQKGGGQRALPLPSRCVVGADGYVRLTTTSTPDDRTWAWQAHAGALAEQRGAEVEQTPVAAAAVVCAALLKNEPPSELKRLLRLGAQSAIGVADFAAELQPIMEAAGGGHYRVVASYLANNFAHLLRLQASATNGELELAHRWRDARARRRRSTSDAVKTAQLRIRPASQEGPARLERVAPVPKNMVLVSGGRYLFSGGDDGEAQRYVDLRPFLLDKTPITWAAYARFCATGVVRAPSSWPASLRAAPSASRVPRHLRNTPVTGISHDDAEAFARFVGKRLPTEAEWELAGRGFDGRLWPYGHEFDAARTHRCGNEPDAITEEDLAITSPFGVSLLGYAWEWTSTPAGDLADIGWVVRGGAWRDSDEPPTLVNRAAERGAATDVTFRCALDFDADAPAEPDHMHDQSHGDTDEGDAVGYGADDTDEGDV